jgi:SAM-dependent methyltransferase
MSDPESPPLPSYDAYYKAFDSPLMQQLRHEAYGKDIGQHSWATAEELEQDISRLKLTPKSRLLDLGCGPCGPLTFIVARVGCHGFGADSSAEAIASGRARTAAMNLEGLLTLQQADLNHPLPSANAAFDGVLSVDVLLHLRDRESVFREVARVLTSGGRFLFTDAAVLTGAISDEEVRLRALHGYTQFVPPGVNEAALEGSGFRLLERQDRTASLLKNASGRLATRLAHRPELEKLEGTANFERQLRYLETAVTLSQRRGLSRMMYLAESM